MLQAKFQTGHIMTQDRGQNSPIQEKGNKTWISILSVVTVASVVFGVVSIKSVQGLKKQQANIVKEKEESEALLDKTRAQLEYFNYQVRESMRKHAPLAEQIEYNQRLDQLSLDLAKPVNDDVDSRLVEWHEEIDRADKILREAEEHPSATTGIYERVQRIAKRLYDRDSQNPEYQRILSVSHERLGDIRLRLGSLDLAFESYESSLSIAKELFENAQQDPKIKRHLSISHSKLGDAQLRKGEFQSALESYQSGIAIKQQLVESEPGNIQLERDLAVSHNQIGFAESKLKNYQSAVKSYQAALEISKQLVEKEPQNVDFQRDLFVSYWKLYSLNRKALDAAETLKNIELAHQQLVHMDSLGILSADDWTYLNNSKLIINSLKSYADN
jgi:tetratricopeptide (TPR) repeat protein